MTLGSRSQTFLPGNIDPGQSNAAVTVFTITNGGTVDSLTLTKPGTSGRFTFKYVAGGYWQRTVESAATIAASIDAVAYGIATTRAVIAPIGRAEYLVDFLGAQTSGNSAFGISGQGSIQLDFSTGRLAISGTLGPTGSETGIFNGNATLSSTANLFSGGFSVGSGSLFSGTLTGRFYGPQAQEIGATFAGTSGSASAPGGNAAIVGTIIGRGGVLGNLPFVPANANAEVAGLVSTFNTAAKTFSGGRTNNLPLVVSFNAATNTYTLINSERSFAGQPNQEVVFGPDKDRIAPYSTNASYDYLTPLRWLETRTNGSSEIYYAYDSITGARTTDGAVPRVGNAGYAVELRGTVADNDAQSLGTLIGNGALYVNFQTGAISSSGRVNVSGSAATPQGFYNATAQLSSSANSFSGTMSLDGVGAYSGTIAGRFYGPTANELGSAFSLADGAGGFISGILFGKDDPALKLDTTGLLDLTAQKTFPSLTASGTGSNLGVGAPPAIAVTFNPATQSYSLNTGLYSTFNVPDTTFGPAKKDAARSNATYTVYQYDQSATNVPTYAITARVLNPGAGNPGIALTYVSLVDLLFYNTTNHAFSSNPNTDTHFTSIYGMNTPTAQMPSTGTASYSALAIGGGMTANSVTNPGVYYYNLTGTAALSFNFGTSTMTGSLSLNGTEFVTAAARSFGTFNFSGSSGNFAGLAGFFSHFDTVGGTVTGYFYGPQGIELGAGFALDTRINGEDMFFSGGFAGKKN